jgi:hypothetical protein
MRTLFCVLAVLLGSDLAIAQDGNATQRNDVPGDDEAEPDGVVQKSIETTKNAVTRPYQFIGFNFGPGALETKAKNEVQKQGTYFDAHTTLLFDFESFSVEGTLSLLQSSLYGETGRGEQTSNVTTTSLDIGGKYYVTQNVEAGGFARWIFGNGSDFGPLQDAEESNLFVGLQIAYDPNWFATARNRFLVTYLLDRSIESRNYTAITLGYEVGLPWYDEEGKWLWQNVK